MYAPMSSLYCTGCVIQASFAGEAYLANHNSVDAEQKEWDI